MRSFTTVIDALQRGEEHCSRYVLVSEYSPTDLYRLFKSDNCFTGRENENVRYTFTERKYRFKVGQVAEETREHIRKEQDFLPHTRIVLECDPSDHDALQHLARLLNCSLQDRKFGLYARGIEAFSAIYGGVSVEERDTWMRKAIYYARQTQQPLPYVGCVIVKEGEQVSFGWRQRRKEKRDGCATLFHAEHIALEMLEGIAQDCDMYITMEPCASRIHEPPQPKLEACIDLIAKAMPRKVIIGWPDINANNMGEAARILPPRGIRVSFYNDGLAKPLCGLQIDRKASRLLTKGIQPAQMFGGYKPWRKETREKERREQEELRESRQERLAARRTCEREKWDW